MKRHVIIVAFSLIIGCPVAFAINIGFQQALEILENAGYTKLHKIELKRHYYEVDVLDANDKRVELKINAMTGEIMPITPKRSKHKHSIKHHPSHPANQ